MAEKAILVDVTKCMACRGCQVACKQWNDLKGEVTTNTGSYENPPNLSPQTWMKVKFTETQRNGTINWLFTRIACMHCTDAACVKVCPTGALYHHELGMVAYNKALCSGCGYCTDFCPFNVPQSDRNLITGIAKMDKCSMCTTPGLNRIDAGYEPACVKTCPTKSLMFGDRTTLVAEGVKRVAALQAKGYNNAYLYGDKELGGTHVMYVLDDNPVAYGLPDKPQFPAIATAWKDIIQTAGWVLGGVAIIGLGLNYIIAREAKIARDLPGKPNEEK